jgi:hypothetical protein
MPGAASDMAAPDASAGNSKRQQKLEKRGGQKVTYR